MADTCQGPLPGSGRRMGEAAQGQARAEVVRDVRTPAGNTGIREDNEERDGLGRHLYPGQECPDAHKEVRERVP